MTYKRPKGLSAKHIRGEVKAALGEVGLEWHRNTLPKHFEESATVRYGYKTRGTKYRRDKLRLFGHSKPLVYKGAMSKMLMRMARITATGKGVRVVMKGPKYLYQSRQDYKQPDKAAEVVKTTTAELRDIERSLHKRLKRGFEKIVSTETTKI